MNDLASTTENRGRLEEAKGLQKQVLELRKEILGDHHPDTISAMDNLASTIKKCGRFEEAEGLQEEAMRLRKVTLGDLHAISGRNP